MWSWSAPVTCSQPITYSGISDLSTIFFFFPCIWRENDQLLFSVWVLLTLHNEAETLHLSILWKMKKCEGEGFSCMQGKIPLMLTVLCYAAYIFGEIYNMWMHLFQKIKRKSTKDLFQHCYCRQQKVNDYRTVELYDYYNWELCY